VRDFDKLSAELIDVQSQLAFQEDTLQALNDALTLQQQEILTLRRQVELLKARQDEQGANADQAAAPALDQPPPHY